MQPPLYKCTDCGEESGDDMDTIECKKCRGGKNGKGQGRVCNTCKGSGYVTITVDSETGAKTIKPAVRP